MLCIFDDIFLIFAKKVILHLKNIGHTFGAKECFQHFTHKIYLGQKIAIIGKNGAGKSTLLKIVSGEIAPKEGSIQGVVQATIGYVAQTITTQLQLSGAERFQKELSQALASKPNLLCLDEPTNHLDAKNKQSLIRMLNRYQGTLVIVTHDVEVLRRCVDQIWHIEEGEIRCLSMSYDEYLQQRATKQAGLKMQLEQLVRDKKKSHQVLMKEQERRKKKQLQGKKKHAEDKLSLRSAQARGEATANRNNKRIRLHKRKVLEELASTKLPEAINPTFNLPLLPIAEEGQWCR